MSRFLPRQNYNEIDVEHLVSCGVNLDMARAMSCRGVTADNAVQYLQHQLYYHDAMLMTNMAEVVDTINDVIDSGGSILIYGDYDADGLSASSLLSLYFTDCGVDNDVIVPTRDMGYGLNVDYVLEQFGNKWYDLIITVDCGISNYQEILQLNQHFEGSVEIVVTDHHELPEILPNCLCINAKMGYAFPYLSGSGVALKLVEALSGRDVARQYLDLALIGTIADIMPMKDENRTIVIDGLNNFNHKSLLKLAQLSRCNKTLTLTDIAMRIAPKINAAGRMGDPMLALKLLLARDRADTDTCNQLIEINAQRRVATDDTYAEAVQKCTNCTQDKLVYVYDDNWQHGLLGIVASMLRQKYGVVSVVMTRDGDKYVGSARSIDDVDLHAVFVSCGHHLLKFGGHKASVGFSVAVENVELLADALKQALTDSTINMSHKTYDIAIDGSVTVATLYQQSLLLEPMHPEDNIVYYAKDRVTKASLFGKDGIHLTFTLNGGLEVKAFGKYAMFYNAMRCGAEVEILCNIGYDNFSNTVVATLLDIVVCNGVHYDGLYSYNYIANLDTTGSVQFDDLAHTLSTVDDSTIILVDSNAQLKLLEQYIDTSREIDYFGKTGNSGGIIVSLQDDNILDRFDNIIALCSSSIARAYHGNVIYCNLAEPTLLANTTIDRDVCVLVYRALLNKKQYDSINDAFTKYLTGKCSIQQYTACIKVLVQLNILTIVDQYAIDIDKYKKVQLENSSIFQLLAN